MSDTVTITAIDGTPVVIHRKHLPALAEAPAWCEGEMDGIDALLSQIDALKKQVQEAREAMRQECIAIIARNKYSDPSDMQAVVNKTIDVCIAEINTLPR